MAKKEKLVLTAEPLIHKDVKGKDMYYVTLSNGTSNHWINVGKNTYDRMVELQTKEVANAEA